MSWDFGAPTFTIGPSPLNARVPELSTSETGVPGFSPLKARVSGFSTLSARMSELSTLAVSASTLEARVSELSTSTLETRFCSFSARLFVRGFLPTEKRSFSNSRS
ncbi:MAG TPA: hypothetical protein VHU80_06170 [Polyangiaceae bacterium]|nr:hypothetical protein [Polyangiaceae bacterium]